MRGSGVLMHEPQLGADQLDHLLGHARALLEDAERIAREQRLLADAGVELASSLDYRATLKSVADLIVERLAEWCIIELVGVDGLIHDVAIAHVDPEKQALAQQLRAKFPSRMDGERGVGRALRTRQPELITGGVPPEMVAPALGIEHPQLLRDLGGSSYVCVPLLARGRALGAITLVRSRPPNYEARDLGLLEELARRAALAIDNARLYAEAEAASRAREELVALVAHDLRNPLGVVVTGTQLLLGPPLPERQARRAVERIQGAARQALRLIQDMLEATKVESGTFAYKLEEQEHPLGNVVEQARGLVEDQARAKDIRLELRVPSDLAVYCDAERICQVLTNLLDNAVRHTGRGGRISVDAQRVDGLVCVTVEDTGEGIPEDELPHIFDRFWQSSHKRSAGAGLGLAIARGIIEAHGERIWATSKLGVGTTFSFTLPSAEGEASRRRPRAATGGALHPGDELAGVASPAVGSPAVGSPAVGSPAVAVAPLAPAREAQPACRASQQ